MLLVCTNFYTYEYKKLSKLYSDKINVIDDNDFKTIDNKIDSDNQFPINFLQEVKLSESMYPITIINFKLDVIAFIKAIALQYTFVYDSYTNKDTVNFINNSDINTIIVTNDNTLEYQLNTVYGFNWLNYENSDYDMSTATNCVINEDNNQQGVDNVVDNGTNGSDQINAVESDKKEEQCESLDILPKNKNKLTLEQLVSTDVDITDADVRDLKATQNKLKVGMLLQAKSMLNRVLKLSTILDKLYDKLLDRIDESIETSDTASLMYTAEYINKALTDTNNFMMSLINNDKIQNFFVIDNSTVINNISDTKVSADSRERVRKAAEIVLDNIDYFASGQFNNLKNPNVVEVQPINNDEGEETNVNTTT